MPTPRGSPSTGSTRRWTGRDRGPDLPDHHREAGRPDRLVPDHRPSPGPTAPRPRRRRRHRHRDRRPVHRPLARRPDPRQPRDPTTPRRTGRDSRPTLDRRRRRLRHGRPEPGPGPGDHRRPRRPAPRSGSGPAGEGRDPDRDRGRHPGTPGAAGLRDPAAGVPGPRHRRGSRLPATAGRGTPRLRGDPALHPAPRRRVRRPARPDPRPRRQPPERLPRRLHRPPTPPPPRDSVDTVETPYGPFGSRRTGRGRPTAAGPATRRGVRRAAGEHPHHQPAPPRRHRDGGDGGPRLPDLLAESTHRASATTSTGERSPPARPGDSPARPGSSPSSSAPTARSSTSAAPDGWSPTRSARP